jgi:LuxR family maltose regulon positive regulatory protein
MDIPPAAGAEQVDPEGAAVLSPREQETLRHLAEGRSTAQIAAAMSLSTNTVRTHIRSIGHKLAVTHRDEVLRRARSMRPPSMEAASTPTPLIDG